MEGWKPQKPTKLDGNQQHQNTFTPSLHLVPFAVTCTNTLFVSCVQRRVVEGSSGGCVVHFDVHGSELCFWLLHAM